MEKEQTRNRLTTEQNLLGAVNEIVEQDGFEALGINAIAAKAGVSKMLIYRYFNSLEGLIAAYIAQYDFWINFHTELPEKTHLPAFLKEICHQHIKTMRENYSLRRLHRWELSSHNSFVEELRHRREENGMRLLERISEVSGRSISEVTFLGTILIPSISYLTLLEENCPIYNGIRIDSDKGWEQIETGLNSFIDLWLSK